MVNLERDLERQASLQLCQQVPIEMFDFLGRFSFVQGQNNPILGFFERAFLDESSGDEVVDPFRLLSEIFKHSGFIQDEGIDAESSFLCLPIEVFQRRLIRLRSLELVRWSLGPMSFVQLVTNRPLDRFCQGAVIRRSGRHQQADHEETGCTCFGEIETKPARFI